MKIAVTGLHAVENPSPGLNVARSLRLGATGATLVGYAYHPLYTGAFDDVWDEVRLAAHPIDVLRDADRLGVAVVIPTIDYEIAPMARHARDDGARLGLPSAHAVAQVNKTRLATLAQAIDLAVPDTTVISSADQASAVLAQFDGKGVVKGGVYGGYRVRTVAEGRRVADGLLRSEDGTIVQRWIDGEEWGIAGAASQGRLLGAMAMRKLGMAESGTTWCGVSVECGDMLDRATAFCAHTQWTGGFELELIREHATRQNYLIEINPRFPSWVFLGAAAGANLPALLAGAVGRGELPADPVCAKPGFVFTRTVVDIVRPLSDLAGFILEGHRP
jgi:hypothetical protein